MVANSPDREADRFRTWFRATLACGFGIHPLTALLRYAWLSVGPAPEAYWGPPIYDWQMAWISPLLPGFLILALLLRRFPTVRLLRGPLAPWRIGGVLALLAIPAALMAWDLTVNTAFPGGGIDITADWSFLLKALFYAAGLAFSLLGLLLWMMLGALLGHLLGKTAVHFQPSSPS